MDHRLLLDAVLALILWSLLVWVWMYVRRIPAMKKAGIDTQSAKHPGSLNQLSSATRAVADNYNHLHEQPTVFYALVFYSYLTDLGNHGNLGDIAIILAWFYVGLRVLHSIVQNTANNVVVRFIVFSLSSISLIALAVLNLIA